MEELFHGKKESIFGYISSQRACGDLREAKLSAPTTEPLADSDIISDVFPAIAVHYSAALGLPIDARLILRAMDGILLPALRVA